VTAQNQRGFSPLIILVLIFILSGTLIYLFKDEIVGKFKQPDKASTDKEIAEISKETSDWKTYNFKYAQISVKYPPNWIVRSPDNYPTDIKFVDFQPLKEGSEISDVYLITVSAGLPIEYISPPFPIEQGMLDLPSDLPAPVPPPTYYPPVPTQANNFNIPALGEGMNALFEQLQDQTVISFRKDGIEYRFTANIYYALQKNIDPIEVTTTLTKMVKSISFTEETASCDNFVLKPLKGFPDSFVLANSHRSDKKDYVSGYYFDIAGNTDRYSLEQSATSIPERLFIVSYERDGEPVTNPRLMSTLVNIESGGDIFSNELSVLYLVNCAQLLTQPGAIKDARIYRIGPTGNNPFNLELYADSKNPTRLWGAKEWNIALLKETRGVVYAKIGDELQKYKATNFYTTIK
jgi:hypothetical protein